jgi:hypothetical protein
VELCLDARWREHMDWVGEEMQAGRQQAQGCALVALLAGFLSIGVAWAGAADDLAREIERTIDDITVEIRIQPKWALAELNEQEQQLETLIQISPEHPAVSDLWERLDELEATLADPDTPTITAPPADIDRTLRRLRNRLKEAETAWLSKDNARAARILHEVQSSLNEFRRERGSEIPQGYVALFVLEERLFVLERELGDADKD